MAQPHVDFWNDPAPVEAPFWDPHFDPQSVTMGEITRQAMAKDKEVVALRTFEVIAARVSRDLLLAIGARVNDIKGMTERNKGLVRDWLQTL